jgi:predicted NUDIX family NTP pyrophosphohydrolase
MPRISAGILLYRIINQELQFFLVHPGGPFFKNKDDGHWTIPKGEPLENEKLADCALREFTEETGLSISGEMIELAPIQQKGGKKVYAWAVMGHIDAAQVKSNTFELEWPPKSGKIQNYPEIDKASWFTLERAKLKINRAQQSFLIEAASVVPEKL